MKPEITKYLQRAIGVDDDGIIGPITKKAYGEKLINLASKEVGIYETSKNHGIGISKYWTACDYSQGYKDRAPYCCAMVVWLIKQAGFFNDKDRPKTAKCFDMEVWGKKLGLKVLINPSQVKKYDLVIFNFSHIGIATSDSDSNGGFSTIEANTSEGDSGSQRDGGGVWKRSREIGLVRSVVRL